MTQRLQQLFIVSGLVAGLVAGLMWVDSVEAQQPESIQLFDPKLKVYRPTETLSGSLVVTGSTTMGNLAFLWGDGFRRYHPEVEIQIAAEGSATSLRRLNSNSVIGLMSRPLTRAERQGFEQKNKYHVTVLRTAHDMVAVIVNAKNPVRNVTLDQLGVMFGDGGSPAIRNWSALSDSRSRIKGRGVGIRLHRLADTSGTSGFFKSIVLKNSPYRSECKVHARYAELVKAVAADPAAIGYTNMSSVHVRGVRPVAIARTSRSKPIAFSENPAQVALYPLKRSLNVVLNLKPKSNLPELQKSFLQYIFSQQGQEDVLKAGFITVSAADGSKQLERAGVLSIQ